MVFVVKIILVEANGRLYYRNDAELVIVVNMPQLARLHFKPFIYVIIQLQLHSKNGYNDPCLNFILC